MSKNSRAQALIRNLGSFWSDIFDDREALAAILNANSLMADQAVVQAQEAVKASAVEQVTRYGRRLWYPLDVPVTDDYLRINETITFGSGETFGAAGLTFGQTRPTYTWTLDIPVEVADIPVIVDRPISPSSVFIKGIDYTVDKDAHTVTFYIDPRINSTGTRTRVNDVLTMRMWGLQTDIRTHYPYKHFGYVLGLPSDDDLAGYLTLLKAFWGILTNGSTSLGLRVALASLCGVELTGPDYEVVEQIVDAAAGVDVIQVITDKRVYTYPNTVTLTVAVGDVVAPGSTMVQDMTFFEGADLDGAMPLVPGLSFDKEQFNFELGGNLVFPNWEVDTTKYTVSGTSMVTFPLIGNPADTAAFWDNAETVGLATGNTVAKAIRTDNSNGPVALSQIPDMVNPTRVLLDAGFKHGFILAHINTSTLETVGLSELSHIIRQSLPPHVILTIQTAVGAPIDYNESISFGAVSSLLAVISNDVTGPTPTFATPGVYGT